MTRLLQAFWQIFLLKKSPEEIPYSQFLLGVVLVLHLLMGFSVGVISHPDISTLASALLSTLLLASISYLLLALHGKANRFVQTAIAAAGCEIIIGVIALPFSFWQSLADKANAHVPVMLLLVLLGWNVVVIAHIWRRALDVQKWQGFLYAIGYMIISIVLDSLIQAPEG